MYEYIATPEGEVESIGRRRGPKAKCDERIALDNLPVGMAVRFPKASVNRGSLQAWQCLIKKERGIKLSVRSRDDHWLVIASEA